MLSKERKYIELSVDTLKNEEESDDHSLDLEGIRKVDISDIINTEKFIKRNYHELEKSNLFIVSSFLGLFTLTYYLLTLFIIPIEFLPILVLTQLIFFHVYVFRILSIEKEYVSRLQFISILSVPLSLGVLDFFLIYNTLFGLASTTTTSALIASVFFYRLKTF